MTGIKRDEPLGFRRVKAIASGEKISHTDDSGDVDIGRLFESRIVGIVRDEKTKEQKKFITIDGDVAYMYKIRILEKSDEATVGNEFLPNPLEPRQMSYLMVNANKSFEELKNTILNLHPEGVFIQEGDASEIPKINDTVIASSEKIQGRFVLTKKFGTMAKTEGGYDPIFEGIADGEARAKFASNGMPIEGSPGVFLKGSSVNWDCLDSEVKAGVKNIARETGLDITVTSGLRNQEQAAAVGSSSKSQHTYGQAVDLRSKDKTLEELKAIKKSAERQGFIVPAKLKHGTEEHFHLELAKKKNQFSDANCAGQSSVANAEFQNDPAKNTGTS